MGYAPDGSANYFYLSPLDVAILLLCLHGAAAMPEEVGYNDARHDLETISNYLENRGMVRVHLMFLEKALYAANLMDEVGYFWHPRVKDFEKLLDNIVTRYERRYNYDRVYNLIKNIKKDRKYKQKDTKKCFTVKK